MAAISFKKTAIPASNTGRVKTPNPYLPHAQAAVEARGEAVTLDNGETDYPNASAITYTLREDETVSTLTRKVREAGAEVDATIRVRASKDDKGRDVVTLWAVDRITRGEKDAEQGAES